MWKQKQSSLPSKKCLSAAYYLTCSLDQHKGMGTLFLSHALYRSCEEEAGSSSSTNLGIPLAPSVPKVLVIVTVCVCGERSLCIRCPKKAPEVVCGYSLKPWTFLWVCGGWGDSDLKKKSTLNLLVILKKMKVKPFQKECVNFQMSPDCWDILCKGRTCQVSSWCGRYFQLHEPLSQPAYFSLSY